MRRSSTRPETIKAGEEAGGRRALEAATPRSSRPPSRWATGAPTRSSRPAAPGRRWPPRRSPSSASGACTGPALAVLHADSRRAGAAARRRRERGGAARAPRPVRLHGRGLHGGRASGSSGPSVGLLSVGEESGKGTPDVLTAHDRHRRGRRAQLRGERRGLRHPDARESTWWWPTGSPATSRSRCSRAPLKVFSAEIRSRIRSGPVSSLGGLLVRGKLGQLRDDFDPEKVGGAILLGLRKPVVVAHGSFGPTRHRARGETGPARGGRGHGRPHHGGARGGRGLAVRDRC